MDMVNLFMQMGIFMSDNGKTIRLMGLVTISMQMELLIMESGRTINNMVKGLKHGLMEQGMKEHILKGKNMERGHYSLQMVVFIQEILCIMRLVE